MLLQQLCGSLKVQQLCGSFKVQHLRGSCMSCMSCMSWCALTRRLSLSLDAGVRPPQGRQLRHPALPCTRRRAGGSRVQAGAGGRGGRRGGERLWERDEW